MSATLPAVDSRVPDRAQRAALGPRGLRGPRLGVDELREAFEALGLDPSSVHRLGSQAEPGHRVHVVGPGEILVGRRFATLNEELSEDSAFMVVLEGSADDARVALWRNALWPAVHVNAILRCSGGRGKRVTMGGVETLDQSFSFDGVVLFGRRTTHVMSPDVTVEKFDRNAKSWDGQPGGAGYPHFRWMRRLVGTFVQPPPRADESGDPVRILDFGCGAGWCGVEAAKAIGHATLSSFDPSPEMVKITGANAEAHGVKSFDGRVGFGEEPPFAGETFDYVISSGVVSFSPDIETWLDGVVAMLAPGADLVIGDIHPSSKGFRRRRKRKPLLPVREMNARTREEIRAGLERRGLTHVRCGAYQLSRPIPEAMHVNETKLKGVLTYPLLWANRLATWLDGSFGSPMQDRFDSWVMHLKAPE